MRRIQFLIVLLASLGLTKESFGQDASLIKIDTLYKECGVIFGAGYELSIESNEIVKRFTPLIEEVARAEKIFLKNYNHANQINEVSKRAKFIADPKSYFTHYIRQYAGYYDKQGNKVILIHLIDNSNPKKVKKEIGDRWKISFIFILAQPMPFDIITYKASLSNEDLSIF